jgi:hypothetical protein
VVSLRSFAVLVLEIDPEEEVDHASGVGRRGEAEEGVLDGGVLRAKEDGLEVSRRLGFVRRRLSLRCNVDFLVEVFLSPANRTKAFRAARFSRRKPLQLRMKSPPHFVIASVFLEMQPDRRSEFEDLKMFSLRPGLQQNGTAEKFLPEPCIRILVSCH